MSFDAGKHRAPGAADQPREQRPAFRPSPRVLYLSDLGRHLREHYGLDAVSGPEAHGTVALRVTPKQGDTLTISCEFIERAGGWLFVWEGEQAPVIDLGHTAQRIAAQLGVGR
jgi:hypothetical protein